MKFEGDLDVIICNPGVVVQTYEVDALPTPFSLA
jgi:hypothetical protein